MLQRIAPIIKFFAVFLLFFILQKPLFLLYNSALFPDKDAGTLYDIIVAGFSMDVSMACYLVTIPLLASILGVFLVGSWLRNFMRGYALLFAFITAAIYVVDMGLFSYWDFRLDSTPLFYFFSSPKSAMASGTVKEFLLAAVLVALYTFVLYKTLMRYVFTRRYWTVSCSKKGGTTLLLLLLGGLVFLGIRGGWTVSTMNTGRAYFSDNDRLNQAAINPMFSFIESLVKGDKVGKQFQFYKKREMKQLVKELYKRKDEQVDLYRVLKTERPDIYLVILESFSTALMECKVGDEEVTPNINGLAKEGVYFSHFYANSFRTDRGLTAILSGYPAQPSYSILKDARKASKLSGIGKLLKEQGYGLNYYYGGDINFTNVNAYLKRQGFENIISDEDFPISEKLSKWGVHDHFVFNRAADEQIHHQFDRPQFTVIQSSSSHEPFEVPYEKFEELKPNAFAYTDHCLGQFIARLRASEKWSNSLVIIVPDHYGSFPEGMTKYEERRFKSPLIWVGGAIAEAQVVEAIGSQMDIAATLMGQLGIPAKGLDFSSNILDSNAAHFAYYAYPGYIGMIKEESGYAYNLVTKELPWKRGEEPVLNRFVEQGKALLQNIYKDIAKK